MTAPDRDEITRATERWFVKQGLPHAIEDYSATDDVFTRAAPFLSLVFLLEVFASFDDRFQGWGQAAVFFGSLAILLAAVVVVNRLRGRRPFQLPDDVGPIELAAFVIVPGLLPLLFSNDGIERFSAIVVFNLALLALTYVSTSYGLFPMIRFGARLMWDRVGQVGLLMARILPLLLLFTAFIFLNAEMWQVASDFAPAFYAMAVGVLVLAGVGFIWLRSPQVVAELEHFESWDTVCRLASATDAPCADVVPRHPERTPSPPLERSAQRNVALLVVISQAVQVVLVALVIGLFYVGFGVLAVRRETVEQWTVGGGDVISSFDFLGSEVILTWEHLAVSGFIAAFSALQFAVSLITDATYREEFYDDVTGEIRQVLAVRSLYLDRT
ncbi:MAG: hypothetical protein ACE367_25795 [Acidimicrobiales bacterium]